METPSCFAILKSLATMPMSESVSRLYSVVRSGLIAFHAITMIRGLEHLVRRHEQRVGVVRRENHGRVPVPAQRGLAGGRLGLDGLTLVRIAIHTQHVAALRLAVDGARVVRIDERHEAVVWPDVNPVEVANTKSTADRIGRSPRRVVLESAVHGDGTSMLYPT